MVQVDEVRVAVEYEMLAAGIGRSDVDGPDLLDIDLMDAVDRRGERQDDAGAHRARILAETGDDAALLGADPVDDREQQPENEKYAEHVEPVRLAVADRKAAAAEALAALLQESVERGDV